MKVTAMGHDIIAIDGPAGSGKSTVARIIADRLNFLYIDTGAMYRALTLKAMRLNIDLQDERSLTDLADTARIDLIAGPDGVKVLLDGEDVASSIRTNELTNNVRFVARIPAVRERMVRLQRMLGEKTNAVLEGRDIGTVVFPDAKFKFYLDADISERTLRRHKDLAAIGQNSGIDEVARDVASRDESDMKRSCGALKKAADAVLIDTTKLTIEQVVRKILSQIDTGGQGLNYEGEARG